MFIELNASFIVVILSLLLSKIKHNKMKSNTPLYHLQWLVPEP